MKSTDKIRQYHREEFINVIDFLCYLAYTQDESIEDIVLWLYNQGFDKDIQSYHIDENDRSLTVGDKNDGVDTYTDDLFEQIAIAGYRNYYSYKQNTLYIPKRPDEHFINVYEFVDSDFYFNLEQLQSLDYLNRLDIDISQGNYSFYTVYLDDKVSARAANKKELIKYKVFTTATCTLEEAQENKKELTFEEAEQYRKQGEKIKENIAIALEWAASSDSNDEQGEGFSNKNSDDYQALTPIQKHTLRMKSITLPVAKEIWTYDKQTNLLMRKQVAQIIVNLLPSLRLRVPQVDKWIKESNLIPQAITDRCNRNDYGNKKHEVIERENIKKKIYIELRNIESNYLSITPTKF